MRAALIGFAATAAGAAMAATLPGVDNPQRAQINWILNCQGCHLASGEGSAGGAPSMVGEVARFLEVDGGRAYLTRVPGVANAGLPDDQLAELLNWSLVQFDAEHVPDDFAPFTAEEVAEGRKAPLVSDAATMRESLRTEFMNTAD